MGLIMVIFKIPIFGFSEILIFGLFRIRSLSFARRSTWYYMSSPNTVSSFTHFFFVSKISVLEQSGSLEGHASFGLGLSFIFFAHFVSIIFV